MKKLEIKLLSLLLVTSAVSAAEIKWQPCTVQADGHTLQIGFRTDIITNDVGYWDHKKAADSGVWWVSNGKDVKVTNYFGYWQPPSEQPFPRTNSNESHWEVYSNTYAMAVCDRQTNTLSESHVKLGDYFKKECTIISASTNTVATESYAPGGKAN